MVSPRTPNIVQKRYGPSEGRNTGTEISKKRFEIEGVQNEVFDYLRTTKNTGGWEDVEPTEEVFLQRALAAINTANARGDGVVEMEEREWKAWQLHEAMEREIEKRVAEREMEREMQRERELARTDELQREREMQRERDLARAEELQRELDMLRRSTRGDTGEPGFLVDQGFSPLGVGYASNSSSSPSLLANAAARPYGLPRREGRFMPDSTDPAFAQTARPALQPRETQSYPTPPLRPPSQPAPASYAQPVKPVTPRRSSSRSSSLSRDGKTRGRSITASTSVPPGADLAPGGSYHPGQHPSIPTSHSTGALGKKERKGRKGESDAEEEVYTSAAAALKDARRRRRG